MNQSSTYLPISPSSHRPRGFTFIEIMVTVIIMGVLSTLGISTFQSTQKKSRDVNRKASLTAVTKALEQYMTDKGQYPASSVDGKILWCGDSDNPESTSCSWGDPLTDVASSGEEKTVYMASLPKDMVTSQTFFYEGVETDGKIKGYKLYARLENDKDQDVPLGTDGKPTRYNQPCRPGDSTDSDLRWCNYVITSDTVAAPIGCGLDKTSCSLAADCCTGKCKNIFYEYDSGYKNNCALNSFCGSEAPTGYTTEKGEDEGGSCTDNTKCCNKLCNTFYAFESDKYTEPTTCPPHKLCGTSNTGYTTTPPKANGTACTAASECCSNSCNTFYTQAQGSTCPTTTVCRVNASTPPTGFFGTCCLTNTSSCTGSGASTTCCGGYCCGGKCQATPCCMASGGDCSSLSCCTGTCDTLYGDADGDGYGVGAAIKRCGAVSGYVANNTDCLDSNASVNPGQTGCFTTNRGDGSFDWNCNGVQSCGTAYYSNVTIGSDCCNTCGSTKGACYNYWTSYPLAGCGGSGYSITYGVSKYVPGPGGCKTSYCGPGGDTFGYQGCN